jgi:hypothetical protein
VAGAAQAAVLLAGRGQAAQLAVLVHGVADPVDAGVLRGRRGGRGAEGLRRWLWLWLGGWGATVAQRRQQLAAAGVQSRCTDRAGGLLWCTRPGCGAEGQAPAEGEAAATPTLADPGPTQQPLLRSAALCCALVPPRLQATPQLAGQLARCLASLHAAGQLQRCLASCRALPRPGSAGCLHCSRPIAAALRRPPRAARPAAAPAT